MKRLIVVAVLLACQPAVAAGKKEHAKAKPAEPPKVELCPPVFDWYKESPEFAAFRKSVEGRKFKYTETCEGVERVTTISFTDCAAHIDYPMQEDATFVSKDTEYFGEHTDSGDWVIRYKDVSGTGSNCGELGAAPESDPPLKLLGTCVDSRCFATIQYIGPS